MPSFYFNHLQLLDFSFVSAIWHYKELEKMSMNLIY